METIGDIKLYSFDEVKDELIGKKGSKARDEYEREVSEALNAYNNRQRQSNK